MLRWQTTAAAVLSTFLGVQAASADIFELEASLNGANVFPPNQSKATGVAVMDYEDFTNLFFLDIVVEGIALSDVFATHLHVGGSAENGPIILNLLAFGSWQQDGKNIRLTIVDGILPEKNELDLLTEMTYIDVHTNAFPLGEIRGPLLLSGGGGGGCEGGPAFNGTINEIRIDQTAADDDEYFEIVGEPGASLDGVFYIVIGDGLAAQGSGVVECIVDLTGYCIPASGRFLVAEQTFNLNGVTPNLILQGANPLNFENSDNVTHMLVRDLNPAIHTGPNGTGGSDLDVDDDGIIDPSGDYDGDGFDDGPPWLEIIDDVAMIVDLKTSELVYSQNHVGPDGAFVPGHIYRCPDGVGAWVIGTFAFTGLDTPGQPNICEGEAEYAELTAVTRITGHHVAGDLSSLLASDNIRYDLRSTFGFTALEPNLTESRIDAVTTHPSPSSLIITIEDHVNNANTFNKVRLRNYQTDVIVQVAQYIASQGTDTINELAPVDANVYVGPGGIIELRLRHTAVATFTALGFNARVDHITILVE